MFLPVGFCNQLFGRRRNIDLKGYRIQAYRTSDNSLTSQAGPVFCAGDHAQLTACSTHCEVLHKVHTGNETLFDRKEAIQAGLEPQLLKHQN